MFHIAWLDTFWTDHSVFCLKHWRTLLQHFSFPFSFFQVAENKLQNFFLNAVYAFLKAGELIQLDNKFQM